MCKLTRQEAENFYQIHQYQPFFGNLVDFMTCDRVVALELLAPGKPCLSIIFCGGSALHSMQIARIYGKCDSMITILWSSIPFEATDPSI